MLQLNATVHIEAEEGQPTRTISGLAVPWNVAAVESGGTAVRFARGSLPTDGPAPKLIESHDSTQVRGLVVERRDTKAGMEFTARIANTRAGDDALELLKMGAIDSVSVGVNPTKWSFDDDGNMVIEAADWKELSLVAFPAFSAAQITRVAAQIPETVPKEDTPMADATPTPVEAAAPSEIPTTPVVFAEPKRAFKLPTPGEYIYAMKRGGHDFAQLNDNITKIAAAQGDVLVSDAAGVVPVPIVAPVYNDINPLRPIVSALGPRSMPDAGATFIRPYVKVHSAVGEQSTELSNLTNADFEVDDIVVTKKTFGGRLYLSEQVIDWSAPSMLDQAILDMAGQYALATEKYAVDQLVGAMSAGNHVLLSSYTDEEEFITDLYSAAAAIAAVGNYLPNVLIIAPEMWARLGALVDSSGRPVFPQAAPLSGIGTLPGGVSSFNGNPLGLNLIVSNQITDQAYGTKDADEFYWLLNTRAIEVYESYKGFIRDDNPSQLGVNIAVRGYFAAQVIDADLVRAIGPAL